MELAHFSSFLLILNSRSYQAVCPGHVSNERDGAVGGVVGEIVSPEIHVTQVS